MSNQYILTVRSSRGEKQIPADGQESLLAALRHAGFTTPAAPCGGNGTCGQCRVKVEGPVLPIGGDEAELSRGEDRLSCRWRPGGDLVVTLPAEKAMNVLVSGVRDIAPCGTGLGAAVDIGTTTVATFLYDLSTGRVLASRGDRNAQRAFGADVISRIQHSAEPGGLKELTARIREQLDEEIQKLCETAGRSVGEIEKVSVAGNTVMEHLFDGLSPVDIGVAPFRPLSLFGDCRAAGALLPSLPSEAEVYLCPALAGYVGGDITAGLYSSGAWESEGLCLFLDIGTNGEMGLGDKNGFLCCATAAGPAFEGAEIACGMDGSPGAVDKVSVADGKLSVHTVADAPAKGICGSGLVDALAAMLKLGVITSAGRLLPPELAPESMRERLRRAEDGEMRFYLRGDVYVSAGDIRQLQLAKAAIRAGAETLLELRGAGSDQLDSPLFAGGFGAYMNVESALAIGLLPPVPAERIRHVGNAAGAGAALALGPDARKALHDFTEKCSYHELSSSKPFMEKYLECMAFEDEEEDE